MKVRFACVLIVCMSAVISGGCGSLSLFSDRHVHYHGSDKVDEKVTTLEKRVEALEKQVQENSKK